MFRTMAKFDFLWNVYYELNKAARPKQTPPPNPLTEYLGTYVFGAKYAISGCSLHNR